MKHGDRLVKVAIWRLISILITLTVLYIVTGSVREATGTTAFLHLLLTFVHYTFESWWERREKK